MSKYLKEHDFPSDLKNMDYDELELLSYEIRDFLVESVSKTGGHLASSLGVVELAIALHRVFDSPKDKLIWDVGHQTYVHKILTGRAEGFEHLRQMGGMSGFPKRCESEHDIFDTGHSSTSVSLGLGLAAARDLTGENYHIVSVIGDGALTGGLSFEGFNHAGHLDTDLIVILNDNGMSISPNIGGLSNHLVKLSGTAGYSAMKTRIKTGVSKVPVIGDDIVSGLQHAKEKIKYSVLEDGVIFEELGFKYIGPVDGHDIKELCEVLENAVKIGGPVLIHTLTTKGKGYPPAEKNPEKFHGTGPFDIATGLPLKSGGGPSWSDVFGDKLVRMAFQDPKIIAVSAAMIDGTGLDMFSRTFPKRIFDVGIAEEHAVSFSAGLAAAGMKPYVAVYSTFLQRAYDQILEDVCLQGLPITFCLDRAGVVGADGETHHGIFDISYLRSMPGMTILAPANARQMEEMMDWSAECSGPCTIRYPRGTAPEGPELPQFEPGKAQRIREGADVDIWSLGTMLPQALRAAEILEGEGIRAGVVNIASVQPLDEDLLAQSAAEHPLIVTLEDNVVSGGAGEHIDRLLSEDPVVVINLGWPDQFIPHGTQDELYEAYGLDGTSIARRISEERNRDRK